ncbi:MAG TPA: metallophosphoesterase [Bacteroidota bacterium]|nr:metallophosphoesterase [Bacteroidota bacterium]
MGYLFSVFIFLGVILLIFGLMQYYEYRTIRRWIRAAFEPDRGGKIRRTLFVILAICNGLLIGQLMLRGNTAYESPLLQFTVVFPAGIFFAVVVLGFLLTFLKDVVRLVLFWTRRVVRLIGHRAKQGSPTVDPHAGAEISEGRRRFLRLSGTAAAGFTLATPLVSAMASPRDYRISRVSLSFPNLPSGLNGLTITQISDVHSGIYMTESHMMEIVELANSLHGNIVALTGDHVDNSDAQIPSVQRAMKELKSDYGVFGCLGNHDHFATAEKVSAALQQVNVTMLDNAHRTLAINGGKISFVGVDDAGRGLSNFARLDDALRGLDPETFKILLSHRPEFFPRAKEAGMDLTLAGHTHGGQVGIEFWGVNLNPAYLVTKYVRGLFNEEGRQMYVNVGVGMVAVPIRIVRPEITLFTLQRS